MDLKDYDYVNECVNFLNSFSASPMKLLTIETPVTGEQIVQYRKAIELTLRSKKNLPDYAAFEKRAESANAFLDKLLKYKKVSRIPR